MAERGLADAARQEITSLTAPPMQYSIATCLRHWRLRASDRPQLNCLCAQREEELGKEEEVEGGKAPRGSLPFPMFQNT